MQDGNTGGSGFTGAPITTNTADIYGGQEVISAPIGAGGEDTGGMNPFGEPPTLQPRTSDGATASSAPPRVPSPAVQPSMRPPAPPDPSPAPSFLMQPSDNQGNASLYSGGMRSDSTEGVEIGIDVHISKGNGGAVHFGGVRRGGGGIIDEIISSTKTILFTSWLNSLLFFIPVCFIARLAGAGDGAIFALAVLSIIPLAERLGFATEEVAGHTNETIGGLLNATFGNVTEMVISFFALAAGELRVVQLSLLGSIFTNTLLVLGMAFLAGGLCHKEQTFNKQGVALNAGLLLLSVVALALPATLQATNTSSVNDSLRISRISSAFLLVGYFSFLAFQLKTHRHLFAEEEEEEGEEGEEEEEEGDDDGGRRKRGGVEQKGLLRQSESSADVGGGGEDGGAGGGGGGGMGNPKGSFSSLSVIAAQQAASVKRHLVRAKQKTNEYSNNVFGFAMIPEIEHDNEPLTLRMSIAWLAVITLFVALLSEALVGAINGASLKYGVPMAFLSAILLPMVGGIAEFAAAVQFAMKDKMDIAIGVAIGSSTQFALLVIPTCVLVGAMIGQPLDLDFGVFESTALLVVVLVVNANVQDGTSNWLKGLMLLVAYATLSVSIFYHTFDEK